MAYRLTAFETGEVTYTLPNAEALFDAGTADSHDSAIKLPDGRVFDVYGSGRAPGKYPRAVRLRGEIVNTTKSAQRAAIDALLGRRGQRGKLYRTALDDSAVQWCYARLMGVGSARGWRNVFYQEFDIRFDALTAWNGTAHGDTSWVFDGGETFDDGLSFDDLSTTTFTADPYGGPQNITLSNGGNTPATNVIITVTVSGGSPKELNWIRFHIEGRVDILYYWPVESGGYLAIDCGAKKVTYDSVYAPRTGGYGGFALGSDHHITDWMRLDPGDNTLAITWGADGSPTVDVSVRYNDLWE